MLVVAAVSLMLSSVVFSFCQQVSKQIVCFFLFFFIFFFIYIYIFFFFFFLSSFSLLFSLSPGLVCHSVVK